MILKLNSRGPEVKELQEFLEIGADGIFGKGTESTVKTWQSSNGLDADGIVGPATWDSMGLATTDTSEKTYTTDNGLVINQHFLPKGEYKNGPINAEYAFIHHTAGWHNPFNCIDQWGRDTRGAVATEFVLGGSSVKGNNTDFDGVMVQAFPEGNYGWHLGKNGSQHMHKNSVGIEVCNFGYIRNGKTYAGTTAAESEIVTLAKPFKGYSDWHRYSDAQIEAMRLWILFIGDRDGIDITEGLPKWIKQNGAAAFEFNQDAYYGKVKGILTHTNTRKDKFDMFPQQELLDMLVSL
tara:strand:- start:1404 stop:2285 length:882 start_codon:yes stop_codon:yes gene_type:complete